MALSERIASGGKAPAEAGPLTLPEKPVVIAEFPKNLESAAAKGVAVRDLVAEELDYQSEHCKKLEQKEDDFTLELEKLSEEIEASNEAPQDFRDRLIAIWPEFGPMWPLIEIAVKQQLSRPPFSKLAEAQSPEEHSARLASLMSKVAIAIVEQFHRTRNVNIMRLAYEQHAVPNDEALDRLFRYEAAIERNLSHALDRLERLQRRRKGEALPPLVSLRLSR